MMGMNECEDEVVKVVFVLSLFCSQILKGWAKLNFLNSL